MTYYKIKVVVMLIIIINMTTTFYFILRFVESTAIIATLSTKSDFSSTSFLSLSMLVV